MGTPVRYSETSKASDPTQAQLVRVKFKFAGAKAFEVYIQGEDNAGYFVQQLRALGAQVIVEKKS